MTTIRSIHRAALRARSTFLVLALVGCGGSAAESTTSESTGEQTSDVHSSGGEQTDRELGRAYWNAELERLRSDPLFVAAYDERAAQLEGRTPSAAECEGLALYDQVARERRDGCDAADPQCAQPSDRAPGPGDGPARPADPECSAQVPPDVAGGDGIPSDVASRLEGCTAAFTSWLFDHCPS